MAISGCFLSHCNKQLVCRFQLAAFGSSAAGINTTHSGTCLRIRDCGDNVGAAVARPDVEHAMSGSYLLLDPRFP